MKIEGREMEKEGTFSASFSLSSGLLVKWITIRGSFTSSHRLVALSGVAVLAVGARAAARSDTGGE